MASKRLVRLNRGSSHVSRRYKSNVTVPSNSFTVPKLFKAMPTVKFMASPVRTLTGCIIDGIVVVHVTRQLEMSGYPFSLSNCGQHSGHSFPTTPKLGLITAHTSTNHNMYDISISLLHSKHFLKGCKGVV